MYKEEIYNILLGLRSITSFFKNCIDSLAPMNVAFQISILTGNTLRLEYLVSLVKDLILEKKNLKFLFGFKLYFLRLKCSHPKRFPNKTLCCSSITI